MTEMSTQGFPNYIQIKRRNPFRDTFMFVDCKDYMADRIFIKHKFRVAYKLEYVKNGTPYIIVMVSYPKRKRALFMECMHELRNSLLICGYADYDAITEGLFGAILSRKYAPSLSEEQGVCSNV